MASTIKIVAGTECFLAEIDESVQQPPPELLVTGGRGIPEGMEGVSEVKRLERNFAEVQQLIVTCCQGLLTAFSQIPKPKRMVAEFGVKLGGETGFPVIAKAAGEASFKVTVEWDNSDPPEPGKGK
jgi:hypothetical protein